MEASCEVKAWGSHGVVALQTVWVCSAVDEPTPELKFQRIQLYLNTKMLFFSSLACTRFRVIISSSLISYLQLPWNIFFLIKTKVLLVPAYFYIHSWPRDIWFILLITKSMTCQFCTNTRDALILLIKNLKDPRPPFRQTRRTETQKYHSQQPSGSPPKRRLPSVVHYYSTYRTPPRTLPH